VRRRHYLSALGTAALGSAAGCSRVQTAVQNRRAASGFDFPPGLSVGGVENPTQLIVGHHEQLQSMTFTAEFVDRSENYFVDGREGRIRSAGTPDYTRWELAHRLSPHTSLYIDPSVRYLERSAERKAELYVGDAAGSSRPFSQAVADSVAPRFREALEAPFGRGDLEIRSEGETDVAVFTATSATTRTVEAVDRLELAVDENGLIRRLEARYTGIRKNPAQTTYEREYHYQIDIGAEPPASLSGVPDRARAFPAFGVEWRDEGRVLEVTNTGGGDVLGNSSTGFLVSHLTVNEMVGGVGISFEPPFSPGETRYLFDRDGIVLADAPPDDASTVLRTDQPPLFHYYNRWDDGNGPAQLKYSAECDDLDCS